MTTSNLPQGWTANGDGIATNNDPQLGGIIDKAIVSGEWFVIFNDDDLEAIEGLSSRAEAFEAFKRAIDAKYWTSN